MKILFAFLFSLALSAAALAQTPTSGRGTTGIAGTANANVTTVQGIAGGTAVPVSGTVTTTLCTTSTCSEAIIPTPTVAAGNAVTVAASTAYATNIVVKGSAGNLYGLFGYNSKTSAQFIQCYNSATLPADTAVPIITFTVPASSNFSLSTGNLPMNFSTGIVCGNSSTGPTKTIGSADTWFNVLFF